MDISTLKQEYTSLKAIKGHFEGEKYNEEVDSYDGKKHKIMNALKEHLGKPKTPAQKIMETMGQPDVITNEIGEGVIEPISFGPGPVLTGNSNNEQAYYLVYKWRGLHDYLHFKIDPNSEEVISSEWYKAGE